MTSVKWQASAQFFAVAAQMMRRILVDAARRRGSRRRDGMAIDEALTAFSKLAPRQAKVVDLRYFGGLTEEEIVAALKISPRTARRD
jgi:DNA-directed RNA polymerase specialized sigma subunit